MRPRGIGCQCVKDPVLTIRHCARDFVLIVNAYGLIIGANEDHVDDTTREVC